MLGLMKAAKKRAGAAKKGKATKMRRIDYGEQIMPKKAAPTAERPPPTATSSSSSSSTVQAPATRPKSKAKRAPEKSADEVKAEASDEKR